MRESTNDKPLVSADELSGMSGDPSLVVVDCRFDLSDPAAGRRAYEAGHVPGAHFADLDNDLAGPVLPETGRHPLPDRQQFLAFLRRIGVDHDSRIVAYDDASGAFASRFWWVVRWVGHTHCSLLDGGLAAWVGAGHRLEPGPGAEAANGTFEGGAATMPTVSTEEIEAGLASGRLHLMDARTQERFDGLVEPIDPVAGHVPGAVCQPFQAHLGDDGRFAPPDVIRALYESSTTEGRDPVCMCGSGVTACHAIFAREYAGLGVAALYVGSWSEWIRDPARPVARSAGSTVNES